MKSVQLAELGEHIQETIEAVRSGETVALLDGECPVAEIKPFPVPAKRPLTADEWADRLEAAGAGRRGPNWGKPLPDDFFTRPRPKADASVLEQLMEDRHSDENEERLSLEGDQTAAHNEPNPIATKPTITADEWADRLEAAGVGRRGPNWGKPLPEEFFTRELPVAKASVLQQLLEDRHSGD
jgi:antitoxin (DNA-binding transcriptional repressor) of toxin-antitoxin stability system